VVVAEQDAHWSELKAVWAQEETKRVQMQLEGVERELWCVTGR
jgi:hypothetical protein